MRDEQKKRLRELERGLAYENAVSTIDCNCVHEETDDDGVLLVWCDLSVDEHDLAADAVRESVEYLELRGLIQRHPSRPELVQMLEESEATDL